MTKEELILYLERMLENMTQLRQKAHEDGEVTLDWHYMGQVMAYDDVLSWARKLEGI